MENKDKKEEKLRFPIIQIHGCTDPTVASCVPANGGGIIEGRYFIIDKLPLRI